MSNKKSIFQYISLTLLVIYLLTTSSVITTSGDDVIGFGGRVSTNKIESGSEASFTGSVMNNFSGEITVNGEKVQTAPLSSVVKAREIAEFLKTEIETGRFLLNKPAELLPDGTGGTVKP